MNRFVKGKKLNAEKLFEALVKNILEGTLTTELPIKRNEYVLLEATIRIGRGEFLLQLQKDDHASNVAIILPNAKPGKQAIQLIRFYSYQHASHGKELGETCHTVFPKHLIKGTDVTRKVLHVREVCNTLLPRACRIDHPLLIEPKKTA